MILTRTPFRISLFGGGTDLPAWFNSNGGAVISFSIDKYCHLSIREMPPYFDYKYRAVYSKIETVNEVEQIEHPAIREAIKKYGNSTKSNLEIQHHGDLPSKSGIGSSSAFVVSIIHGLNKMNNIELNKKELSLMAIDLEQNSIGENVGSQDQFHAAFGGLNIIEFDKERILIRPVIVNREKKKLLEESMLVFFTGVTRFASDILDEQMKKTSRLDNDIYLQQLYDMVFEAEEILSEASPSTLLKSFGQLLDKGWQLKRQLSGKISNPTIDEAYARGLAAGAYGGKLCGAGGGGFLLFLAPVALHSQIEKAVGLLRVNFAFEQEGSKIIYMKD